MRARCSPACGSRSRRWERGLSMVVHEFIRTRQAPGRSFRPSRPGATDFSWPAFRSASSVKAAHFTAKPSPIWPMPGCASQAIPSSRNSSNSSGPRTAFFIRQSVPGQQAGRTSGGRPGPAGCAKQAAIHPGHRHLLGRRGVGILADGTKPRAREFLHQQGHEGGHRIEAPVDRIAHWTAPAASSHIVANNINVSLLAWALGLTFGIGTVWLLSSTV